MGGGPTVPYRGDRCTITGVVTKVCSKKYTGGVPIKCIPVIKAWTFFRICSFERLHVMASNTKSDSFVPSIPYYTLRIGITYHLQNVNF